jgi:transcriptional regulator with XRE-family HTH domain
VTNELDKNQTDSETPFRALGIRLKALRTEQGKSQQQLAEEANVAYRTLQYLESGKRAPQRATLVQLADALGVGYDELRAVAGRPSVDQALTESELDRLAELLVERMRPLLVELFRQA